MTKRPARRAKARKTVRLRDFGGCPRCQHDLWLHRSDDLPELVQLMPEEYEDHCPRCYDCSAVIAEDEDLSAENC